MNRIKNRFRHAGQIALGALGAGAVWGLAALGSVYTPWHWLSFSFEIIGGFAALFTIGFLFATVVTFLTGGFAAPGLKHICPNCGSEVYPTAAEWDSQRGRCPKCGREFKA